MKVKLWSSKTTNLKDLQQEITKLWVLNLVESMPRRRQAVIDAEANPTKY
jgi:hypothetical protein